MKHSPEVLELLAKAFRNDRILEILNRQKELMEKIVSLGSSEENASEVRIILRKLEYGSRELWKEVDKL